MDIVVNKSFYIFTIREHCEYPDHKQNSKIPTSSISGYGLQLTNEGPFVSGRSRKQPTVALSTGGAEYIALTDAVQKAKFLKQLCEDLSIVQAEHSVLMHGDNQDAINLAKNPVYHKKRNMSM